jgi:alpha-L-fucosidase 2
MFVRCLVARFVLVLWIFYAGAGRVCSAAPAPPQYPGTLEWNSPGTNSSAAVPLGNGDFGISAWVDPTAGTLACYLGKTDAWSSQGRLLKLGCLRIRLAPNPFSAGSVFRQVLSLDDARLIINAGPSNQTVRLVLWVDANHPVAHVQIDAPNPYELTAELDLWRTNQIVLAGYARQSAFGLLHAPFPVAEEPDTIWTGRTNTVVWYHHNLTSIWQKDRKSVV